MINFEEYFIKTTIIKIFNTYFFHDLIMTIFVEYSITRHFMLRIIFKDSKRRMIEDRLQN